MPERIEEGKSMKKKSFNPEKYGMVVCPDCNSNGYFEYPERQCCQKCGGFGFIKKEEEPPKKEDEEEARN